MYKGLDGGENTECSRTRERSAWLGKRYESVRGIR